MALLQGGGQVETIVQWPLLYGNEELVGRGTLLTISPLECLVVGTMAVATGMLLKLWISPPEREDALYVKDARVLSTRGNQFRLDLRDLDAQDREWLMSFLSRRGALDAHHAAPEISG